MHGLPIFIRSSPPGVVPQSSPVALLLKASDVRDPSSFSLELGSPAEEWHPRRTSPNDTDPLVRHGSAINCWQLTEDKGYKVLIWTFDNQESSKMNIWHTLLPLLLTEGLGKRVFPFITCCSTLNSLSSFGSVIQCHETYFMKCWKERCNFYCVLFSKYVVYVLLQYTQATTVDVTMF